MNNSKKEYYAPMHSAEHILNRTMINLFHCERSKNCHIERKKSKCDFLLKKKPTDEQIQTIEKNVNNIIRKKLDITHKFINFDDANKLFNLKVKKEENEKIRITSIGNFDDCPCIGEHVQNTSEIGVFKITTTTYENNILRIRFKLIH